MAARQHIMLSGRFNNKETMNYMKEVKCALEKQGAPVFMVDAGPGQSFADQTVMGMAGAGAMVAFCTEDYGEKTGAKYETYVELKYAYENDVHIIPVKLSPVYPPQPPEPEGRGQNSFIFSKSLVYIDDSKMADPRRVGGEILKSLYVQGLVQKCVMLRHDIPIEHSDGEIVWYASGHFAWKWFGSCFTYFPSSVEGMAKYSPEIQQQMLSESAPTSADDCDFFGKD